MTQRFLKTLLLPFLAVLYLCLLPNFCVHDFLHVFYTLTSTHPNSRSQNQSVFWLLYMRKKAGLCLSNHFSVLYRYQGLNSEIRIKLIYPPETKLFCFLGTWRAFFYEVMCVLLLKLGRKFRKSFFISRSIAGPNLRIILTIQYCLTLSINCRYVS